VQRTNRKRKTFLHEVKEKSPEAKRDSIKEIAGSRSICVSYPIETTEGKVRVVTNAPKVVEMIYKEKNKDKNMSAETTAKGLVMQMIMDERIDSTSGLIQPECEETDWIMNITAEQLFYDDLSGEALDGQLVKLARAEEMTEFDKHTVYTKVPLKECWDVTGKAPIGVRWVDVNKGDKVHPEIRSRLVAKEINSHKRDDLFAATPPIECKKMLFSMAATEGIGYRRGQKLKGMTIDFIDVRRAYFHAESRRTVYVRSPPRGLRAWSVRKIKSMYGTRDAAQNWEVAYNPFMENTGFRAGKASPCLFYHPQRRIRVVVYGDDFTVLGEEAQLNWFTTKINEKFETKHRARFGPEAKDGKSVRILNRVVTWTEKGVDYEPDQRHTDVILQQLGLSSKSKALSSPMLKPSDIKEEDGDETELQRDQATLHRAITARGLYLAQDRSDIQFAVKELSRQMSQPTKRYWKALVRLGRYLIGKPRVVLDYQGPIDKVGVWGDTDFAGCKRTRRSTTGGAAQLGKHTIKTWSVTQAVVAQSSGEAEYYGLVKDSSTATGIKNMMADLGVDLGLEVKTDASSAKGIASRKGIGKVRHIEVCQLWLQDKVRLGEIVITKVGGKDNAADALSNPLAADEIAKHQKTLDQTNEEGRHELCPEPTDVRQDNKDWEAIEDDGGEG